MTKPEFKMSNAMNTSPCQSRSHLTRRSLLRGAGTAGISWLTPLADILAVEAERAPKGKPARSVILLWLGGAASQLDTFDPHPTTKIGGGVKTIPTAIKGVEFAAGLEQTASVMQDVSLIRSMVSKEGDHERAFYNIKTGYRPDPTLIHPSIGAIACHELPEAKIEIPTHVSILPNQWPARGGFFGPQYDAFQVYDPKSSIPDVLARVEDQRLERRLESLSVVERAFVEQLLANPALLAKQARIVPKQKDDEVLGYKLYGIRRGSLPKLLGLKNGDMITAVNGEELKGMDKAMALYTKLRRASNLSISIERKGQTVNKEIQIQ